MLADDDPDDVVVFKLALQKLEIAVHLRHAADGDMLFILLRQLIPDVLFLDINMPCKDGISCILEIRRNSEYNNMPVIMYTGFKGEQYVDACYKNGANFYMLKDNVANLAIKLKKIFSIDWKNYHYFPSREEFVLGEV